MPKIFLSPSTQYYNLYIIGGEERYYMNRVADAMIPLLLASGIGYGRNDPAGTVANSVTLSNAGKYDLHLAIHSNAGPQHLAGQLTGADTYYYPGSGAGAYYAGLITQSLRQSYPASQTVQALASGAIFEIRQVRAVAVLVELAYHDNAEDARWLIANIDVLARALAQASADYFGLPLLQPFSPPHQGTVITKGGNVNIRSYPSYSAPISGSAPSGAQLKLNGQNGEWYSVDYLGLIGFANANFIELS
jgi:N-acetylmuramoyl-L-alanine amidase